MMEALISSPVFGNLRREPQVLQRMMPREVITRLQLAGDDGLRFSDRRALCCESPLSRGGGIGDPMGVLQWRSRNYHASDISPSTYRPPQLLPVLHHVRQNIRVRRDLGVPAGRTPGQSNHFIGGSKRRG